MKKNTTIFFSSENGQNVTITAEQQIDVEEDFDSTEKCGSASDSSAVSLYIHREDASVGLRGPGWWGEGGPPHQKKYACQLFSLFSLASMGCESINKRRMD